jgi:hypothetical protein
MNDEDFAKFLLISNGVVSSGELREVVDKLKAAASRDSLRGTSILQKLQLYMFANAASRMCYLDPQHRVPHIESYANEHDVVTRLGVLAKDDFHREDLLRIDGSLFTCDRYGHLLNAHYLPEFCADRYTLCTEGPEKSVGTSVHDPVLGNPCTKHPKHVPGSGISRLRELYVAAQRL